MIYFLTAMYYEAEPIISYYKMKKVMEAKKFQVFKAIDKLLIISGVGSLKASVAVTYILNSFNYKEDDIFINIGICGAVNENLCEGQVIMCNKVLDSYANKTLYPDMLLKHPFSEGTLHSFPKAVMEKVEGDIVDMEGAFFFQTAVMFLKPHNIHIIKIVSDFLKPESVNSNNIKSLLKRSMPEVLLWIDSISEEKYDKKNIFTSDEVCILDLLVQNLKLTTSMKIELSKLCKHYKLRNRQLLEKLKSYAEFKCKSKMEGKKIFGQLRQELMEL
jgi:nucleoside phosphorylase